MDRRISVHTCIEMHTDKHTRARTHTRTHTRAHTPISVCLSVSRACACVPVYKRLCGFVLSSRTSASLVRRGIRHLT